MATTRTPLQPTETLEAFHNVGCHVYLVRYPKGQEDRARECIARWVRNKDLAFSWADASVMGEQLPYEPEPVIDCDCDACRFGINAEKIAELESDVRTLYRRVGFVLLAIGVAVWWF